MKALLLTLTVFAVTITALHAQVLPDTVPAALAPDPLVQAAVEEAVGAKHKAIAGLALIALMWFGRAIPVLQKGTGLVGWFRAILFGTNTPMRVWIGCFAAVTLLTSCDTPRTAAEAAKRQQYANVGDKLLKLGVKSGIISTDEAADIKDLGVIILNPSPPASAATTSGK